MNLSLQEVDHILKALDTMSSHDVARAREQIAPGVVDHLRLVQKLRDYIGTPLYKRYLCSLEISGCKNCTEIF